MKPKNNDKITSIQTSITSFLPKQSKQKSIQKPEKLYNLKDKKG